jgi:hypothetical protein
MRFAMWLLQRFGVPERNESLMGDLAEERSAGRSALWLWGQTLAAIGDAVAGDLLDHWLLALRAIAMGWAVSLAWWWGMNALLSGVGHDGNGFLSGYRWRAYQILLPFTLFLWPVVVGWIVARSHRAQRGTMVLAFATSVALPAAWYLTTHYSQIESSCVQCVPDGGVVNLAICCLYVLGILIGGLVVPHRRRIA